MSRQTFRTCLSIVMACGFIAAAQAVEVPMAVHPGAKSGGPERVGFQLPETAAREVNLAFPAELRSKSAGPKPEEPDNRIGLSRRAELDARPTEGLLPAWTETPGGFVARFTVRSEGALRLRVGVIVPTAEDGMEIRFAPAGSVQAEVLSAGWIRETYGANPGLVWTPSTAGEAQSVELFVPGTRRPSGDTGLVHDISHLYVDPFALPSAAKEAKLLSCHQNYSCSTNPDITTAGKAVARLIITSPDGSSSFCSGALVNDLGGVRRYFATAFHCIGVASEAASVQFGWFFEQACGAQELVPGGSTSQGAQLLRADRQNDFSFVQITGSIPAGTTLLGFNSANLASGTGVFGIHHPAGVPKAFSTGGSAGKQTTSARLPSGEVLTVNGNRVEWSAGNTEGGSSGSPLMTGAGIFRGALSMGPRDPSCTGTRWSLYSDFNLTYPLVQQWLSPSSGSSDDFPNTASAASTATSYSNAFLKMRLDSASDQDWLRFDFPQPGVWIVYTTAEPGGANVDTFGRIFASNGTTQLADNDDGPEGFGGNFAFFLNVGTPGTYFLQVTGFQGATGNFELVSIYDPNDDHSDLPFLGTRLDAGVSLSARLEASGDSDYFFFDVPSTGPVTISSSGPTDVMAALRNSSFTQIAFNDDASASDRNFRISATLPAGRYYLQVLGYDPDTTGPYTVTVALTSAPAPNYTGLWWIPSENGWGINTNHQGDVLFATLFTYATDGEALWLVASNLARQPDGSFTGQLFRTRGPPYFTTPWTPSTVQASPVGTMTWRFNSVTSAQLVYTFEGRTVRKNVVRQEFASPVPACTPTTASRASESNYQDLWWGGQSESGWGINFTHQGTTIFGTLFTYDNDGRDAWLFSGMARQGNAFTGPMFIARGPPYFTEPWTPIGTNELGAMTFRPTSGDRGTLTYNVGATQVVKSILRQDFGLANRPVCR